MQVNFKRYGWPFASVTIAFRAGLSPSRFFFSRKNILVVMAPNSSAAESYLLGAFNIRAFGIKKLADDNDTLKHIVKILRRYDICFLQEVREADNKLNPDGSSPLLTRLIEKVSTKTKPYDESNLFDDENFGDVFEREPFSARFSLISKPHVHLALLGVHVKPTDAVKEIGSLHHCFEKLSIQWTPKEEPKQEKKKPKRKWYHYLFSCICPTISQEDEGSAAELGNMNKTMLIGPVIMGDLNAGKNYLGVKARKQVELYTNREKYTWLIEDDVDTTVAESTDYPYDRIIVPTAQSHHFRNAKPYPFDEKLNLESEAALAVSDHYPVEVELLP
ncbi:Deoxyribonuclease-1 [Entomophthora muscae]|uniref:Deoxyribonuclease-1 n=1 Tax=Entomophthora muscae TaxID=34485 RepID=A0ACC2RHM0_9FUNG|nr:Deoxyribonuclease-1 [Entomophthora muscae]